MRVVVVGLGVQGRKRVATVGKEVVATVDPVVADAQYKAVDEVPLDSYDAAMVCTPDSAKLEHLQYFLTGGKHVLVEKPLLATDSTQIVRLGEAARKNRVTCYTAYNHRFEPHIGRMKVLLDTQMLGAIYFMRALYGNGTALDVKRSPWRDRGLGVLADLGSHLLDLTLFLFGQSARRFTLWGLNRFENRAADHVLFGSAEKPVLEFEATLVSWRNTFTLDVIGETGSAHIRGLCKWGPSTLTVRKRVYPSGPPEETVQTIESPDPTWAAEYEHFKRLCATRDANIENDLWINSVLNELAQTAGQELL